MKKTPFEYFMKAQKSAHERYGLWLDRPMYDSFLRKIKDGNALRLSRKSWQRFHYLIDDQFIVIYDKRMNVISAFLPPEAITDYLPKRETGS